MFSYKDRPIQPVYLLISGQNLDFERRAVTGRRDDNVSRENIACSSTPDFKFNDN